MIVPEEYVIQKFYQHAGYPKYAKSTNTYTGGCPVCREGKSWGRKRRAYYIPNDQAICCHNCGWYGNPVKWVMEVEQISFKEVAQQIETCDFEYGIPKTRPDNVYETPDLPKDSINLFDKSQVMYYKDEDIVKTAIETIVTRRLNTAINKPKALFVSLSDFVHKNRLILPFYDRSGKSVHYQSRTLLESDRDRPKYLSKQNSDKTLFNYNNIESSADNIFITEGPIDSFFIKNSVAVAGIQERSKESLTSKQRAQIDRLFLMQSVWVLDSQWGDQASRLKSETLLTNGACVFIWPKNIGTRFKDINEMCVHFKLDHISEQFILDNTYCGLKGLVKIKQIR